MPLMLVFRRHVLAIILLFTSVVAGSAQPQNQSNTLAIETARLANGMEIIIVPDHRSQVMTHMVWFRVGSIDDPKGKSGIAHFFEHLMFRGTKTIGEGEFWRQVNAMGGQLNAFTSYDFTGYYERVTSDKLAEVMRLEADRMQNLIIDDKIVGIERDVILEERSIRVDSNPRQILSEKLMARLHAGSPYDTPIIGWRDEIAQLNATDARAFYQRYYAPDNAILLVAGDITMDELLPLAKTIYGPLKAANKPREKFAPAASLRVADHQVPEKYADPRVRQQLWQRIFRLPAYHSVANKGDFAALAVAAEILGGGPTSRLHQSLAVESKQAASISSYADSWQLHEGMFTISANLMPQAQFNDIAVLVDAEIAALADQPPEASELARAKVQIIADSLYARDSQSYLANAFGAAAVISIEPQTVIDWPQLIDSVSAEDVRRAVSTMLIAQHSVTGWLIQAEGEASYAP